MTQLPQVTLIAVCTRDVESTGRALVYSCQGITFAQVKMVSPYRPTDLPKWILWEHVPAFESIDSWNHYIFYNLWRHFTTEYCLLIHNDGFVVNPQSWREAFLDFDYIGAGWAIECAHAIRGPRVDTHPLVRVGNSVGIKSRKLCKLPTDLGLPWIPYNGDYNEDTQFSAHNRQVFEQNGCIWAPLELAVYFSREEDIPEGQHVEYPFCFHKWTGRNHIYPRF